MTSRHPAHDIFVMAAGDAEQSGLTEDEVRALIIRMVPSLEHDLDIILDSGGLISRAGEQAREPAQGQASESSESGPKSFSDRLRDELRARVAQNQVAPE